jgi:hypothetical protein
MDSEVCGRPRHATNLELIVRRRRPVVPNYVPTGGPGVSHERVARPFAQVRTLPNQNYDI